MRILIAGGDGYLGWPTAMNLSTQGHDIAVADNYLRRDMALQENVEPLYSVPNLNERSKIWKQKTGKDIQVDIGDLTNWDFVSKVFNEFQPEAVIHYAEQPSNPDAYKGTGCSCKVSWRLDGTGFR